MIAALLLVTSLAAVTKTDTATAADWVRFRGNNGDGVSPDDKPTPAKWSETENLKWKLELPGNGLSSPIVVGDKVLVTCWSGYGISQREPGDQKSLQRHLVCVDRNTGNTLWSKAVDPVLPEESFRGMFAENGYASHTPVSDGERVYVFFGKTGVLAFDLQGNQLWQKSVGTGSDRMGWGSASSPVLYKDLVIVTAAAESAAMYAFNKLTGQQVWKAEADGFSGTWATPVLVDAGEGRQDLVLSVPYEIWAFNPDTGKLRWYCEGVGSSSICSSLVASDGVVYALGGQSGGSLAVRVGGKDNVTDSHVVWTGNDRSRISTPVLHDGKLYIVGSGVVSCLDAKTGDRIAQARLGSGGRDTGRNDDEGGSDGGRDSGAGRGGPSGRFGGGGAFGGGGFGRGGGFGGMGGQDYSSPVVADGKLYFTTRRGEMHVVKLGEKPELLSTNRLGSDAGEFSATPAVSNGELFIRSSKYLFCIAESK
jgi:outer membrane protein assembly factor BamB